MAKHDSQSPEHGWLSKEQKLLKKDTNERHIGGIH
jgi:hypothetical protein